MPIVRPDAAGPPRRGRLRAVLGTLLALALLLGGTTGCGLVADPPAPRPGATVLGTAEVAERLQELMTRRARAVRRGDRRAWVATLLPARGLDREQRRDRRRQLRLFDNLRDLPLARHAYRVDPATVVRTSRGLQAEVTGVLQLDGFDAVPVRTPDLVRFVRLPGGGFRVASAWDEEWSRERLLAPQPWQQSRVVVLEGDGVLVVTDEGGRERAAPLVAAAERAVADVAPLVPYPWDRTVVVHALSTPRALGGLVEVPGGDPELLDGVSVPVRARPTGGRLASTRVVLHPRMLDRDPRARDRLLRHELVHVALAARDDGVPTWLAEGIAEWVSVQAMPAQERTIARSAVAAAREGIDDLPPDDGFNGPRSGVHYGVAWWAVEHVVAAFGTEVLWQLFESLRGEAADPAAVDARLREVLGLDGQDLASRAGTGIVTTFG